jgi:hypothetical protein
VLALIISIGLISWRFAPLALGFFDGTAAEAIVSETAVQQVLEENAQVLTTTMELESFADLPTSRPTNAGPNQTAVVSTPTADPTRSPLPATLDRIDIELDVTERTWLSVTVDGAIAYEGQARKGDVLHGMPPVRLRSAQGMGREYLLKSMA